MTGTIYDGVVIRTTHVLSVAGSTTSVPVSEVIYSEYGFAARDGSHAATILLAAAVKAVKDLDLTSAVNPVETKIRAWA